MGEELKLTRRSILAGAAATGAIVQAASAPAQAQAVMTKATAADIAKLPRIKPKLVDPPSCMRMSRSRPEAPRSSSSR